jgi:hypothetical protein
MGIALFPQLQITNTALCSKSNLSFLFEKKNRSSSPVDSTLLVDHHSNDKLQGRIISFLVEVDACLARDCVESVLLDGLEGLGGEAQLDEALAGLPPQLLVLQVHKLLLLGLLVGEGHLVGAVRLLVREGANPTCIQNQIGQASKFRHFDCSI